MLDDVLNKYNNTVHITIKIKPIDITGDYYIESNGTDFNKDSMESYSMKLHSNKNNPKFKVGDHVRISKYKNIFSKRYTQIGQKKFLILIKLKIQFLGLMLLAI